MHAAAEGEVQLPQSGWHGAQVPFVAMAPEGQVAMQLPELAERGAVQRVQCVEEPRHSAQPDEQPKG